MNSPPSRTLSGAPHSTAYHRTSRGAAQSVATDSSSQRPGSFVLIYLLDGMTFLAFIPILLFWLRLPPQPSTTAGEERTRPPVRACHRWRPLAASSAYTDPSPLPTTTSP